MFTHTTSKNKPSLLSVEAIVSPFSFLTQKASIEKGGFTNRMHLSFQVFDAQLKYPFTVSGFTRTTTPIVLTEISFDGITGYGEASMPPYLGESQATVMDFLNNVNLKQFRTPFELDEIITYVDNIAINNTAAKASIDIALHDLVGKLMEQPCHTLWGYMPDKVPISSFTIGIDTEEAVRKKMLETDSFKAIKVKLGVDETTDKMLINTVRSITDKTIRVDANQGWKDKNYALRMIEWLSEQNVELVEQPMPKQSIDEMAWLTEQSPLPTFADESCQRLEDISKLKGVFNGINIKLMKCTGMREAHEMIKVAKACNMRLMIGCMTETSCAIAAAAQLSPQMEFADLDGNLLITNDVFTGTTLTNGKVMLNNEWGIGVTKL